ncbi:MAG: sugar ABC transporter permease [Candidatus Sericytochromatia bacterium]|nr:sugar ABC transporter permease [Candidatus Sericytochromatia bacterium]
MAQPTKSLTPYLFLAPALAVLGVFFVWPLLHALYLSVTYYQLGGGSSWAGLAHYAHLWRDPLFWKATGQTFLYLVGVVPPLVILSLGLAIAVNQKLPGIRLFRAAYYLPVVVSMVVVGIAWRWLYAEQGLLNALLGGIGMASIGWLTSPDLAIWSVMAVTVWKGLGYYMVIYLAGLQTIPRDLFEAAELDGATTAQAHWAVTVPLMRPSIALVSIISSISALKVFTEIFVMTGGGPLDRTQTLVYYVYEQGFTNADFSYACAVGMVLFAIVLGFSLLNLKFFESGKVQA